MTNCCLLAVLSLGLLQASGSVVFATHQSCPQAIFRLIGHEGLELLGRCDASRQELHLSIRNRAAASAGPLQGFTLAFCRHSVVSVHAPDGWTASLGTGEPQQTIEWSFTESATSRGIEPGGQVEGFSVRLAPGWVMSQYLMVHWAETSSGQVVDHDCP